MKVLQHENSSSAFTGQYSGRLNRRNRVRRGDLMTAPFDVFAHSGSADIQSAFNIPCRQRPFLISTQLCNFPQSLIRLKCLNPYPRKARAHILRKLFRQFHASLSIEMVVEPNTALHRRRR